VPLIEIVLYSLDTARWKIADFAFTSEGSSKRSRTSETGRGTEGFRAPELLREKCGYTNKVDIWSLGCILHELATGVRLFQSDWATMEYAVSTNSIQIYPFIASTPNSVLLTELLCKMLARNPSDRPSATYLWTKFSLLLDPNLSEFTPLTPIRQRREEEDRKMTYQVESDQMVRKKHIKNRRLLFIFIVGLILISVISILLLPLLYSVFPVKVNSNAIETPYIEILQALVKDVCSDSDIPTEMGDTSVFVMPQADVTPTQVAFNFTSLKVGS
jgi:serine/threonine protein kinase